MHIKISNLSKVYKVNKKEFYAIENINLEINSGEILCILGHNGAGKTTLIKSICGLVEPTIGSVEVDTIDITKNTKLAHELCGTVLEGSRNIYYYLTAYENARYFGLLNGLSNEEIKEKTDYYFKLFDLKKFENSNVSTFSRGMQQKLAIIIALMKNPKILLLDEPTLGLDLISADYVIMILKKLIKEDIIILVTTHDINLIEKLNSRIIFMNKGKIIKDSDLTSLKNINLESKFKITYAKDKENLLPNVYELVEETDSIIIFYTEDKKWIEKNISEDRMIQIEKEGKNISDIYRIVMEERI